MQRRLTPGGAAVIALVAVIACEPGADTEAVESGTQAAPRYQIRDSADIRIIENRRPAEGSRLGWKIGAEPVFTIGSVEAGEDFQLHQVDDAFKLGDGRLVVANGGSHQLMVFDEGGTYLTAWGQKGEGPGDFGGFWGGDAFGLEAFLGGTVARRLHRGLSRNFFSGAGTVFRLWAGRPTCPNRRPGSRRIRHQMSGGAARRGDHRH